MGLRAVDHHRSSWVASMHEQAIPSESDSGAKAVLMRVQTADGDRFVAFAFPKA